MNMMKRIVALALLAALCLSLIACGSGTPEPGKEIVGTWKNADGQTMTFKADGTGTVPSTAGTSGCTWRYDEKSGTYTIDLNYTNAAVTVKNTDGKYTFDYNGVPYTKQ